MARAVKISAGQLPCPTHPWGSGVVSVGIAQKFVGKCILTGTCMVDHNFLTIIFKYVTPCVSA